MAKIIQSAKLHCQDSRDEKHALDLLALEDEARIKRNHLAQKINFEHSVQEQNRQDIISTLKREIHDLEMQFLKEIHALARDYSNMEGELSILEQNTDNRLDHLQKCHDNQVTRLYEFMDRMKAKIAYAQEAMPEADKEIAELEKLEKNTDGTKLTMKLEEKVEKLRNTERKLHQECFYTEQALRDEATSLVDPGELRMLEQDLVSAQRKAKKTKTTEEETIRDLNLDNVHITKEINRIISQDPDELADKFTKEIEQIIKDTEIEDLTLKNLKRDREMMVQHFKMKFQSKLERQAERIKEEKEGMKAAMKKRLDEEKELDNEIKHIPKALEESKKFFVEQYKGRMDMMKEREAQVDINFKEEVANLKNAHADQANTLKNQMKKLEADAKEKRNHYQKAKKLLERQIDKKTSSLPELIDMMDKVDKNFVDAMSPKQGILDKYEVINKLNLELKEEGVENPITDFLKLDSITEANLKEIEDEIERKNVELQDLFYRHREIATDFDFMDRKVRIATRDLRNETNHLKYKLRMLRRVIREQNYIIANLNLTATKSEQDLVDMIKRSQIAMEEEKKRLTLLMTDETEAQQKSIDRLQNDVNIAKRYGESLVADHVAFRKALLEKINANKEVADIRLDLQHDIQELGAKIQELASKINDLATDHQNYLKKTQNKFAMYMQDLLGQKKQQENELSKQKKLNSKAVNLEKMLDSIDDAMEALNNDAVIADTDEQEALKNSLTKLCLKNDHLSSKVKQVGKKNQQTKTHIKLLSSLNPKDLQQNQTLHAAFYSELSNLRNQVSETSADKNSDT